MFFLQFNSTFFKMRTCSSHSDLFKGMKNNGFCALHYHSVQISSRHRWVHPLHINNRTQKRRTSSVKLPRCNLTMFIDSFEDSDSFISSPIFINTTHKLCWHSCSTVLLPFPVTQTEGIHQVSFFFPESSLFACSIFASSLGPLLVSFKEPSLAVLTSTVYCNVDVAFASLSRLWSQGQEDI